MLLPIRPEGTALTAEQAKILDDEFFMSRPLAHYSSRIAMLLDAERTSRQPTPEDDGALFDALGLTDTSGLLQFDLRERRVQVALDALTLRHHAAEALVRFVYALTVAEPRTGDAPCVWLAVAESPTRMITVVEANEAAHQKDPSAFLAHLLPPEAPIDETAVDAAHTAIDWISHAVSLLTGDELSINAANNKVKHGLAVSARGDVRIELVTASPDEEGNIPVSAFGEGKSMPIFDRPMLTYLSRPHAAVKQGLEIVSLRVDLPVVLAETWMMANVYAALFHVAARKHFGTPLPDGVAPYPKLAVNRLPKDVVGGRPLGYRAAVTTPPDGTTAPRESGLFFHRKFWPMTIDFARSAPGQIVDG